MARSDDLRPAAASRSDTPLGWILFWFASFAFWPRLFIVGFWIFGSTIGDAFSSALIPILGLVIAPWTTFAYAIMWGMSSDAVSGAEWIVVALGVLLDLFTWSLARALFRGADVSRA